MALPWIGWVLLGYASGSVPFGWLIGRVCGVDIRGHGSGNVGATNVGRVLGRKWGGICLSLDLLKGLGPVLLSGWAMGCLREPGIAPSQAWQWMAVGAGAMLGHMYPVWLGFKGGKGVATGLGVTLGFWPTLTIPAAAAAAVWGVTLGLWRYVSVASMAAAATVPLLVLARWGVTGRSFGETAPFFIPTLVLAVLVFVRHRGNIARLRVGTEPKVGQRDAHAEK